MSITNGALPPRQINFSFIQRGVSLDSRFYEEHPEPIKEKIDNIARGVFDPDGGHVLVIGVSSAGKSFLIEQFASNVQQYISNTNLKKLEIMEVSRADAASIEQIPNGVEVYIETLKQLLRCDESELCLVSESPDFVAAVCAKKPDIKIILEMNISTYVQLSLREEQGISKLWSSWEIVDANEVLLSYEDLVSTLESVMIPKLKESNITDISNGEIEELIDYFTEKLPEILYVEDSEENPLNESYILVPPGLWGLAARKLGTALAFSKSKVLQNEEGHLDFEKVCSEVFEELEPNFVDFLNMLDDNDENSEINSFINGFLGGMNPSSIQVVHMGQKTNEEEQEEIKQFEFSELSSLKERLKKTVLGQESAVHSVVDSLTVPAAGLHDVNKPLRSFMFLGPTGVGKTQLALSLANEVSSEPLNVIRLDMSEYSQPHEASKLLGAPSGYVGYEEGGVLTNLVKANPNSVILLDEVEKAHYKIWDSFLQIFDAGRMTDNKGQEIDFTKSIIIMTSNLGAKESSGHDLGFFSDNSIEEKRKDAVTREVESFFRPEFINRIDELVHFNPLSMEIAREIVKREIDIVSERMIPRGFKLLKFEDNVVDEIINLSKFNKYGARDIQRAVFKNISQPLAERMLSKTHKRKTIKLSINSSDKIQAK